MSVFFPSLPVDLLRRRDQRERVSPARTHEPILVVGGRQQRRIIACCCDRALDAGVRPGMTLAEARAVFASPPRVEPHEPERDLRLLQALALRAQKFAPVVGLDPPDGLLLDITGCERLFRSEKRLLKLVLRYFSRRGFTCRAVIAPSFACAWGVARFGLHSSPGGIIPRERLREALEPLPLAALRIEEAAITALDHVGVQRVGELLSLPRSSLPARFGPDIIRRIDLALGRLSQTLHAVNDVQPVQRERVLDGPSTQPEVLELVARELIAGILRDLATKGLGPSRLEFAIFHPHHSPTIVPVQLGRASGDARHLWSLTRPRLERVPVDLGIDRVVLIAPASAALEERQLSCLDGDPSLDHARAFIKPVSELVDTLASRLGFERICAPCTLESHLPERAAGTRPLVDPRDLPRPSSSALPPRPTLLLSTPERCDVTLDERDHFSTLFWRGVMRRIARASPPERIAPEWWRSSCATIVPAERSCSSDLSCTFPTRDYFRIQDDAGLHLWIFRELHPLSPMHEPRPDRWFVHGVWA